jgi:formyltetrahydrofolate deformylase
MAGQVLLLRCADQRGIVAAVASFLAEQGATITESNHFNDGTSGLFAMRTAFAGDGAPLPDVDTLRQRFAPIADRFAMDWSLHDMARRPPAARRVQVRALPVRSAAPLARRAAAGGHRRRGVQP